MGHPLAVSEETSKSEAELEAKGSLAMLDAGILLPAVQGVETSGQRGSGAEVQDCLFSSEVAREVWSAEEIRSGIYVKQ